MDEMSETISVQNQEKFVENCYHFQDKIMKILTELNILRVIAFPKSQHCKNTLLKIFYRMKEKHCKKIAMKKKYKLAI